MIPLFICIWLKIDRFSTAAFLVAMTFRSYKDGWLFFFIDVSRPVKLLLNAGFVVSGRLILSSLAFLVAIGSSPNFRSLFFSCVLSVWLKAPWLKLPPYMLLLLLFLPMYSVDREDLAISLLTTLRRCYWTTSLTCLGLDRYLAPWPYDTIWLSYRFILLPSASFWNCYYPV